MVKDNKFAAESTADSTADSKVDNKDSKVTTTGNLMQNDGKKDPSARPDNHEQVGSVKTPESDKGSTPEGFPNDQVANTAKTPAKSQLKAQTEAEQKLVKEAEKEKELNAKQKKAIYEDVVRGVTPATVADLHGVEPRRVVEVFEEVNREKNGK